MNPITRVLVGAILRAVVLTTCFRVVDLVWRANTVGGGGADIGGGMVLLGSLVLVSALWGSYDGRRHPPRWLTATWLGAGAAFAVFMTVWTTLTGGWLGVADLMLSVGIGLMLALPLIGVVGLVGGLVGSALPQGAGRTWRTGR